MSMINACKMVEVGMLDEGPAVSGEVLSGASL